MCVRALLSALCVGCLFCCSAVGQYYKPSYPPQVTEDRQPGLVTTPSVESRPVGQAVPAPWSPISEGDGISSSRQGIVSVPGTGTTSPAPIGGGPQSPPPIREQDLQSLLQRVEALLRAPSVVPTLPSLGAIGESVSSLLTGLRLLLWLGIANLGLSVGGTVLPLVARVAGGLLATAKEKLQASLATAGGGSSPPASLSPVGNPAAGSSTVKPG